MPERATLCSAVCNHISYLDLRQSVHFKSFARAAFINGEMGLSRTEGGTATKDNDHAQHQRYLTLTQALNWLIRAIAGIGRQNDRSLENENKILKAIQSLRDDLLKPAIMFEVGKPKDKEL